MKKIILFLFSLCLYASVVSAQQTTIRTPITNPQFDNKPANAQIQIKPAPNQAPHEQEWFNELGIVGCYVGTDGLLNCQQDCSTAFTSGCGGAGGGAAPPLYSIQFNDPLGFFDGSGSFTATPTSGTAPNQLLAILLSLGTTLEVDAPLSPGANNCFIDGKFNDCKADGANAGDITFEFDGSDQEFPTQTGITLTNIGVASGVVTATTSTDISGYGPGSFVTFSGLTGDTDLNGKYAQIWTSSATGFTAYSTQASDYSAAPETGQVLPLSIDAIDTNYIGMDPHQPGNYGIGQQIVMLAETYNTSTVQSATGLDISFSDPQVTQAHGIYVHDTSVGANQSEQILLDPQTSYYSPGNNDYHQYDVMQISNLNESPSFWWYSDGSVHSISSFSTNQSAAVSCTESDTGTCAASITNNVGGPPATETIIGQFCASAPGYDVFDWSHDPSALLCVGGNNIQQVAGSSPGNYLEDGVNVLFSSVTGHTPGTTFSIPVTITPGPQMTSFGAGTVGYTAAQIAALTPFPFEEVWITDGTTDCTTGLGTAVFKCAYVAGAWVPEGSGVPTLTLAAGTTLAVAAGPGFVFTCSDCDTPTAEGAVCTATGDHAKAQALYIRGAVHCF